MKNCFTIFKKDEKPKNILFIRIFQTYLLFKLWIQNIDYGMMQIYLKNE